MNINPDPIEGHQITSTPNNIAFPSEVTALFLALAESGLCPTADADEFGITVRWSDLMGTEQNLRSGVPLDYAFDVDLRTGVVLDANHDITYELAA